MLEAKLGKDVGREEALREALPTYYSQAVRENDVDVIAAPEIEITAGKDEGPVAFDAVVEVRPVIAVGGYDAPAGRDPSARGRPTRRSTPRSTGCATSSAS